MAGEAPSQWMFVGGHLPGVLDEITVSPVNVGVVDPDGDWVTISGSPTEKIDVRLLRAGVVVTRSIPEGNELHLNLQSLLWWCWRPMPTPNAMSALTHPALVHP